MNETMALSKKWGAIVFSATETAEKGFERGLASTPLTPSTIPTPSKYMILLLQVKALMTAKTKDYDLSYIKVNTKFTSASLSSRSW